jgi:hypothetical protein
VPASRVLRFAPFGAVICVLLGSASSAVAADERNRSLSQQRAVPRLVSDAPSDSSSFAARSLLGRSAFSITGNVMAAQHDGTTNHLPPTQSNIELVGKLEMNTPVERRFDPVTGDPDPTEPAVVPGQIADLAIHKGFAYLNSWDEPSCARGGTFIVDINNPAAPQQVGFLPALEGRYHGEGAHVVTLDTPVFQGDVLAVNNEPYSSTACTLNQDRPFLGGFDLYDVTSPNAPRTFAQGVGDTGPEGDLEGNHPSAHSSHSTFVWQGNDRRAFVVFVDNAELNDVDIFEITDPANPQPVGEFDLVELADAQGVDIVDDSALGNGIFLHDMVVKKIGDRFILLANYWDAGYVTVDVTNPGNPQIIADTTYDGFDPLTGFDPPEGNGHQGELSHDNKYILAADEDFGACRFDARITSGPNTDAPLIATEGSDVPPLCPDNDMVDETRFVGEACAANPLPPAPAGITIALVARGTCSFQEKYNTVIAAGYDAGIVFNSNSATNGCDSLLSMLVSDDGIADPIPFLFIPRSLGFKILGAWDPATYNCTPGGAATPVPAAPQDAAAVQFLALFDGWGYAHLYEADVDPAGPNKMHRVDSYAIEEALNPAYTLGYGDLSIHEFATDPTTNIAYSSYYSGGMRVFSFGPGGLTEQGKFIDQGGSNFWGVEQFTTPQGERLFAGSDRDYGLYILKYTGPGAPATPAAPPAGSPGPAARVFRSPSLSNRTIRVTRNRIARVGITCAETRGGNCAGILTLGRRAQSVTLSRKSFSTAADVNSTVATKLTKKEFNRLVRKGRQRVTIEVLTRSGDGVLRRATTRVTLLAPSSVRG